MKVLLVGDKDHVFIYNLVKWLRKTNKSIKSIDVISRKRTKNNTDKYYSNIFCYEPFNVSVLFLRRFYKEKSKNIYFKKKIKKIEKNYDLIHIHYVEHRLVENADFIAKNITGRLVVTVWGSDFYRSNEYSRKRMLPIFKRADKISFENPEMMEEFKLYYSLKFGLNFDKLCVVRFGLAPLEQLKLLDLNRKECKSKINIPPTAVSICIGYNASMGQQHLTILDSIEKIIGKLNKEIYVILPLTYGGNKDYFGQITDKLNSLSYNVKVFTGFLSNYDVAVIRKATDYFINLQITDQLSGSMLEHIYAGNVIITGSWLPYNILNELGVEIVKIDEVGQIGEKVYELIQSEEHFKNEPKNSKKIYQFSYWGNCIKEWNNLYANN